MHIEVWLHLDEYFFQHFQIFLNPFFCFFSFCFNIKRWYLHACGCILPAPLNCRNEHTVPTGRGAFPRSCSAKKHEEIPLQDEGRGCWKPTAADNWGAPCRQVGASHPPTAPAAPPAQHELRRWEPNHSGFVYTGRALLLAVLAPVLRVDGTYAREGIPLPAAPYFPR